MQPVPSLAPAATAVWRRVVFLTTMALGLTATARATLLVYEPFDYSTGGALGGNTPPEVTGMAGYSGMAGSWTAKCNGGDANFKVITGLPPIVNGPPDVAYFDGKGLTSVPFSPASGKYAGSYKIDSSPDHLWAHIPLHEDVVATFQTDGAVTWMSCVVAANHSRWAAFSLAIGSGYVDGLNDVRGTIATGPTIGIGQYGISRDTPSKFAATWWNNAANNVDPGTDKFVFTRDNKPIILVAKITWHTSPEPEVVQIAAFPDGTTLTEAGFNAVAQSNSADLDQSGFSTLSVAGDRYSFDELRVGTTFFDVIGVVPDPVCWAQGANGGDSGTWSSSSANWAIAPGVHGSSTQSTTSTLVFTSTPGVVTLAGTVTAAKGLQFSSGGYSLVGAAPAKINLSGVDATENTLTVGTGISATISAAVAGSFGLTKDGPGTLVLGNPSNPLGGGVVLKAGTLQIAAVGSLGPNGDVDFQGGTLQYPPGRGSSGIDVSPRIPTIADGQVASIDTNGCDVSFGTAVEGFGGLAKLGNGSLTLAVPNNYAGPTTVSGGTLNVRSTSGTLETLNVPAGGTVNLGPGAMVTTLHITGGTVNITGSGVQIGTLMATSGTLNASAFSVTLTSNATVNGIKFVAGSGTFSLGGSNVISPDASHHRAVTVNSGTLAVMSYGFDVIIGGQVTTKGTTTLGSQGVYSMTAVNAPDILTYLWCNGPACGYFHYAPVPNGDFDIKVKISGSGGAQYGVMLRDAVNPDGSGNWADVYRGWHTIFPVKNMTWYNKSGFNAGITPLGAADSAQWLELKRSGNSLYAYYSNDGLTYTLMEEPLNYPSPPFDISAWGANTYLCFTLSGGKSLNGTFEAELPMLDMSTTDLALGSGTKLGLDYTGTTTIGALSIGGVYQATGTWGATMATPTPDHGDDIHFSGTGILQLGTYVPPPVATTTTLTTSGSPSIDGGPVTFTATIAPASGADVPTGTVQFMVDGSPLNGPVTVTTGSPPNSIAAVSTSGLTVAGSPHAITAEFTASGNFSNSTSTLAGDQAVNPPPAPAVFSGLTASQSIAAGTAYVTLTGTLSSDDGALYPAHDEPLSLTINGVTQNTSINGGVGWFTLDFPTASIPGSPTPYTITYRYAGGTTLSAAPDDTSTTLTVVATDVYAGWIASKHLTGAAAAATADPDHDGIPNNIEFVLGSEPNPANPGSNSRSLLPAISRNTAGDMLFTFHRKTLSTSSALLTFQWSTDLGFPLSNNVPVGAVNSTINGVTVDVAGNSPDAATDLIVITVPATKAAGGKLFGRLGVAIQATVPSATAYDTWVAAKQLAGADAAFSADPDLDGITNLLEFVLGGEPNPARPNSNSLGLMPSVMPSAGNLVFTYRRTSVSLTQSGIAITAEYGSDLTTWTPARPGVNGVTITTTTDGFGAGIDKVEVSIPRALATGAQLFVHLKVTVP
ncbi:MAG: autotransporter-associated beta strand repeat-containing protein [Verrucomicrobiota bacterium]